MQMKGIDVSSYQGDIDFEQVKNAGIDFVIIKAGEWDHTVDKFEENYAAAKAAGLHIGFYWFCDGETISEIEQEADACIKALRGKQFDFPIYMDLENRYQYVLGRDFCSAAVRTFCGKLEKAGYYTGLYTSTSWLDSVIDDDIKEKYTIWVADWRGYCGYEGEYGIWQYGAGYVPGINGKTDLNIIDIGFETDYPGVVIDDGVDLDYGYVDFPSLIIPNGLNNYPKPSDTAWENDPCRDVANTLNIKGATPVLSGDRWFLIDKSCSFTLETLPYANVNIYLVGGGSDGEEWFQDPNYPYECFDIAIGSRGGCVLKKQIYITGNVECQAIVANANVPAGTSLKIGNDLYKCTDSGYIHRRATASGNAKLDEGGNFNAESGANGVATPYGYVGSCGGGGGTYSIQNRQYIEVGAGKGGAGAGNGGTVKKNGMDAVNYGCGGGAAGFGGFPSDGDVVETHAGRGMGGCIIFEILDSGACDGSPNKPVESNNSCGCSCECPHHEFECPDPAEGSAHCEQEKEYKLVYEGGEPVITENTTVSPSGTVQSDEKAVVSGITPVESGFDTQYGNWFLIDQSGVFSVDRDIMATIWLVGGGCDGGDGNWISYEPIYGDDGYWHIKPGTGSGTSYAGNGGNGGYVHVVDNVKISKNADNMVVIAEANDVSGTNVTVNSKVYSCEDNSYTARIGGNGGGVMNDGSIIQPTNGENGVSTPCQVVGSSGGGGLSCNGFNITEDDGNVSVISAGGDGAGDGSAHRDVGLPAVNYGCGGGGGCICGHNDAASHDNAWGGGKGMQGCVIIAYKTFDANTDTECNCPKPEHNENHGNTSNCGCSSGSNGGYSCGCGSCGSGRCVSYDVRRWGENWLLFDKSGEYSLTMEDDVTFTAYLVGGGCDGRDGIYYNKTAYGGDGGRGGFVNVVRDIKVSKGQIDITVKIGKRGDFGGTSVIINNNGYCCNGSGNSVNDGGFQGISGKYAFRNAGNGSNGIETPFGYVGSSGGGGAAYCNGATSGYGKGGISAGNGGKIVDGKSTAGERAEGYGCGGGGGSASPNSWCAGGKGKQGCIILTW